MVDSSKKIGAQIPGFPSKFQNHFIAIVLVLPWRTHSDRCRFARDMIRLQPMISIRRPSNPGSSSTEDTEFIRCVDGREPQIHKMWCLSLDSIYQEVHPTARVVVISGTVGEFTTDYLAENGCRISIIRQLSINYSVQFLGVPNFIRGSGLLFIPKFQAPADPTVW